MQRQNQGTLMYMLGDKNHYDTVDGYQPGTMYKEIVENSAVEKGWKIFRGSVWYNCLNPLGKQPVQGWKIHVSATRDNAKEILAIVSKICLEDGTNFKFCLDETILILINSKGWSRGGSGKFITIYPGSEQKFIFLLNELYTKLKAFAGPYILSDKRYKDCKVLYYRYGGFLLESELTHTGEIRAFIRDPEGEKYQDVRNPYYSLPPWVQEPFPDEGQDSSEGEEENLFNGTYRVEAAIGFSNTGGVYKAIDIATEEKVLIKEARGNLGFDSQGNYATSLLEKEYRLLKKMEPYGIAPKPLDSFWEWEHYFIVMEFIEGSPLTGYPARQSIAIKQAVTSQQAREYAEELKSIWGKIADILLILHDNNIVFGDLSPNNLMYDMESGSIKIIDFEGACEVGVDKPAFLFTPGFANESHRQSGASGFSNDFFALGAVFLFTIIPINAILDIAPKTIRKFLREITDDFNLPKEFMSLPLSLMNNEQKSLRDVKDIIDSISTDGSIEFPKPPGDKTSRLHGDYNLDPNLVDQVINYLYQVANHSRPDRLFPADAQVFSKNGINVAYGATGVLYALKQLNMDIPQRWVDWVFARLREQECAPGLYVGHAGIAWVLQELGFRRTAESVFKSTLNNPLIYKSADILYGASGWGMTALKFWLDTKDDFYISCATQVGEWLLENKVEESEHYRWASDDDVVWLGYTRGASGIALYLLYLYLTTGESKYLEAGKKGLAFDLSYLDDRLGGLSIPESVTMSEILLPYWAFGSAGVGTTLLRYYLITGKEEYGKALEGLISDTSYKYTVNPGLAMGLTGLGNFLVDCHQFLNSGDCVARIRRNLEGLRLFQIKQDNNSIAFPGDGLQRISTDFATGSSGIVLYLNRVLNNTGNYNFVLDRLLDKARFMVSPRESGAGKQEIIPEEV